MPVPEESGSSCFRGRALPSSRAGSQGELSGPSEHWAALPSDWCPGALSLGAEMRGPEALLLLLLLLASLTGRTCPSRRDPCF